MRTPDYVVVSTMKNEAPYILEWVAHHLVLGFDHMVVCTNDCADPTVEILKRLEEMGHVTHHATRVGHAGIHRSALRQASRYPVVRGATWVYVCDVDEYLNVHVGDGSVQALVAHAASDGIDVIAVPWRVFGPNGQQKIEDRPVTAQFTQAEQPYDPATNPKAGLFCKSLYRNQDKFQRMGLHAPIERDEFRAEIRFVDGDGTLRRENGKRLESYAPSWNGAQVNHYALRSMEAFLVKRDRGRANHSHHRQGIAYWRKFDRGGVEDRSILRYADRLQAMVDGFRSDAVLGPLHAAAVEWHQRKAASLRMDPENDALVEALCATLKRSTDLEAETAA